MCILFINRQTGYKNVRVGHKLPQAKNTFLMSKMQILHFVFTTYSGFPGIHFYILMEKIKQNNIKILYIMNCIMFLIFLTKI